MEEPAVLEAPSGGVSAEATPSETPIQAAPVEAASGAVPADEFADLEQQLAGDPRLPAFKERLAKLAQQRDEYRTQLEQLEPYQAHLPILTQLAEKTGLPLETVAERLSEYDPQQFQPPPPAPPDPNARQEAFAAWLETKAPTVRSEWDYQDAATREYWVDRFEQHEAKLAQDQQREQDQARQIMQQAEMQLRELQMEPKYGGLFKEEQPFADLIRLAQATGYDGKTVADLMHGVVERRVQAAIARYQSGKQADAAFPVAAGGTSPAPMEKLDLSDRQNRLKALEAQLGASQGVV